MFPVLFVNYLTFFFPALAPSANAAHPLMGSLFRWFIAFLVILTAMAVNLRGSREVGNSAKISATFVLSAFALLVIVWLLWGPRRA